MAIGEILAGKAFVEVGTRDKLDLRKLQNKLKKFGSAIGAIGKKLTIASTAMLAPLAAVTKFFATMGDNLDKLSNRTGFSTEALSELGFAAGLSGSSLESLGAALFRMRRRVANAATATGPAVRALKELKLEARDLKRLNPEQIFFKIVDAMNALGNESRAAQLGFEIFGDNLKDLFPLLKAGTAGIEEMRKEARRLGLPVSKEAADRAAELTDKMSKLTLVLKDAAFEMGNAVAPAVGKVTDRMTDATVKGAKWVENNQDLVTSLAKVTVGALGVGIAFQGFSVVTNILLRMADVLKNIATFSLKAGKSLKTVLFPVAGASAAAQVRTLLAKRLLKGGALLGGPVGLALLVNEILDATLPESFETIDAPKRRARRVAAIEEMLGQADLARQFLDEKKIEQKQLEEIKRMREATDRLVRHLTRRAEVERETRRLGLGLGPTEQDLANQRRAIELNLPTSFDTDRDLKRGGFLIQELLGDLLGSVISRGTFSGVGARFLGGGPSVETKQLDKLEDIDDKLAKILENPGQLFA